LAPTPGRGDRGGSAAHHPESIAGSRLTYLLTPSVACTEPEKAAIVDFVPARGALRGPLGGLPSGAQAYSTR
jgi:hypothetical protein